MKSLPINTLQKADYLFFVFSKILNFFLDPLNLLLISFLIYIVIVARAKRNKFKGAFWFILFWFILLYKPLPEFLVKSIEDPYVYTESVFLGLEGLIILGGGTGSGKVAAARSDYTLGEGSERIIKGLEFLKKKPEGKVIFTGFSGKLFHEGLSEAEIIEQLIRALNADSTNFLFEQRSRNTFENALYSGEIVQSLRIENWGIVTSASHMKRATATFEKQCPDINFEPIPVDFRTANSIYWGPGNMQGSIDLWRIYIHETVGYWVYKLTRKL